MRKHVCAVAVGECSAENPMVQRSPSCALFNEGISIATSIAIYFDEVQVPQLAELANQ
jgi:hypothetical protein